MKDFDEKPRRFLSGPGQKTTLYNKNHGQCARECCERDWCDAFNYYKKSRWSGDCYLLELKAGQTLDHKNYRYTFYEKKSDTGIEIY